MTGLAGAVAGVLETFTTAGVRAVDDLRNVNPPCLYLVPPEGSFRFDRGRVDVEWVAYLVVGNAGTHAAMVALSDVVDAVAGLHSFTTFTRDAVADPGGGDALPALRLSWKSTVPIGA